MGAWLDSGSAFDTAHDSCRSSQSARLTDTPTKTALIIRHVPIEGLAGYREPIEAAGYRLNRVDVTDDGFGDIDLCEPDLLIMMGGPMGVYDAGTHPWIGCQIRRLARRLARRLPTLGVCLGAQMIAAALGARVFRGSRPEIGFHPVRALADDSPLAQLGGAPVLHWHSDSFDLPDDAEWLASSYAYRHQAFRVGPNILAVQFHAEMGLDPRFHQWVDRWPEAPGEAGTSASALRLSYDLHGPAAVAAGQRMIAAWLRGLEHWPARARPGGG